LKKILNSARPGRPSDNVPPPGQAAQNQQPPAPQENSGFAQPQQSDQTAQLRMPPQTRLQPDFNARMTPGSMIDQAERSVAESRGHNGGSGQAGDYGSPGRSGARALDQAEILTDTMGVDFGPYLTRIVAIVKQNWYNLMPPSVYPPILKQGKLAIEFVILKDGKTTSMAVRTSSGDVALDRAAWGSITASTPFPPLPKEFPGQILGLRFYYFYNLQPGADLK
jgi:TonB family protein